MANDAVMDSAGINRDDSHHNPRGAITVLGKTKAAITKGTSTFFFLTASVNPRAKRHHLVLPDSKECLRAPLVFFCSDCRSSSWHGRSTDLELLESR